MAPGRRKQSRLQFSPLPSSSPSKKEYSQAVQDRLAGVRFGSMVGRSGRMAKGERDAIPTPEPSSQIYQDSRPGNPEHGSQESDDEEVLPPAKKRRRTSTTQPECFVITPARLTRSNRKTHATPRSTPPSSTPSARRLRSVNIPDDSSAPSPMTEVNAELSPLQRSRTRRISTSSSGLGSPETSEDEAGVLSSKPTIRRRGRKRSPAEKDRFVVSDDVKVLSLSGHESADVTPSSKGKSNPTNQTPRSRRLKSKREHQELKEDLEDLQGLDPTELQDSRTRGAPVNKARERRREHLELLKRRRAGESEKKPVRLDSSEAEDADQTARPGDHPEDIFAPFLGSPHDGRSNVGTSEDDQAAPDPDLDVSEEDFVVSDEGGEEQVQKQANGLSRPQPDIPIEFTSYASATPRELFVFVIDWLVKNKIAPAFSRHDALWNLAFSKIKGEMTAQAGSRLRSSAWTGAFTMALNARPNLKISGLDLGDAERRGCDACNRRNHPAQYDFVFTGPAYHHGTLEPVDQDSTSEGEENDDKDKEKTEGDKVSVDSQGHTIPPITTHFHLGRYCANNAELAHKFTHWKASLNEQLVSYLESQGVLSAEAIVRRERSKGGQKKREKEAEELVDRMQAAGIVEQLWRGLRSDLDDARMGMEGFERRGARGNMRIGSVRMMAGGVDDDDSSLL